MIVPHDASPSSPRWRAGLWACWLFLFCAGLTNASAQPLAALGPLDDSGRVTYFIAEGEAGSGYRESDRELAAWALAAWQQAAAPALTFVPVDSERDALVKVYWAPPGGGQYGEMLALDMDGKRGAAVFIRPDTAALGPEIASRAAEDPLFRDTIVYLTCLHELGHALGLPHTAGFDDIMYFFGFGGDITEYFERYRRRLGDRAEIGRHSGLSPADVERLRELYEDGRAQP